MKKQIAVILGLIFTFSIFATAQTKTVTNADLEKFRQERLRAEREYRENYERLGFPSPEELERQREEDRVRREELAENLRRERLEREAIQAQREENRALQRQNEILTVIANQNNQNDRYYGGYYPYGFTGYYYNNRFRRYPRNYGTTVYPPQGFFTPQQLQTIYSGRPPFNFHNRNLRIHTPRPIVKINIGGGRKR